MGFGGGLQQQGWLGGGVAGAAVCGEVTGWQQGVEQSVGIWADVQ